MRKAAPVLLPMALFAVKKEGLQAGSNAPSSKPASPLFITLSEEIDAMARVTGREEARLDRPSMTGCAAALEAREYPQLAAQIGFPHVRFAALRVAPRP